MSYNSHTTTMTTTHASAGLSTTKARLKNQISGQDNAITTVLIWWFILGLFLDGWAHNNLPGSLETFFTPWHGILYSGFFATAMWMNFLVFRNYKHNPNSKLFDLIPTGYEYGFLGMLLFFLSGLTDMLWHTLFGIEANIEALLSPPHLLLFVGGLLMVSSPLRASWANKNIQAPRMTEFFPALFSMFAVLAAVGFFQQFFWAVSRVLHNKKQMEYFASLLVNPNSFEGQLMVQRASLAGILVTNIVLMAATLMLLRRFKLPFTSLSMLFGINSILMIGMVGFARHPEQMVANMIAGVLADVLYWWLQPSTQKVHEMRLFAFLVPLEFWSLHFLATQFTTGSNFSFQMQAGITIMAALSGFGLSLLMAPTASVSPDV